MIPLKRLWFKLIVLMALSLQANVVTAQLKANFSATPVTGCPPMVVNFRDLSTGNPTAWQWDLGNGTISTLQHPTATYFDPGKYLVKLVIKNSAGADSISRSQYIVVNAPPTVNFSASDSTGCYPLRVSFKEFSTAGSGTIKSYEWDFGDGALSSEQTPTHTYTNAGSFTVTLRVYNTNGCVKIFTKPNYIKLQDGVKSDFSYVSSAGCLPPTPVTFTNKATGTGALTYKWLFGDGATSTQKDPVHNYVLPGAYTVKLIVTNASGCSDTMTKANAINIGFVKADFSRPDTVCAGSTFAIQNTSNPATVGSNWYYSDGGQSTVISPTKIFANPGTYIIKLVNDFGSCKDSITKSIVVIGKPTGTISATNNVGCNIPLNVSFQSNTPAAVSYLWDFGDGTTSTQKNPSHVYGAYGNYSVKLMIANNKGCGDTIIVVDLVKIVKPTILNVTGLPVRGCIPYTVSPKVNVQTTQPITSYFWDFGDGFTSTSSSPVHTYTTSGRYTVKVAVSTAAGCTDTLRMTEAVVVGTKPSAAFGGTPLAVCAENSVTFSDLSPGLNHEWYWQFGDGGTSTKQSPIYNYVDTGKFDVTLTVTNFGCSDTLKKIQYIHVVPPIAKFDTAFLCSDRLTRKFINKSIGATTWYWQFGDGSESYEQHPPAHTYAAPGVYTVVLRVTNGQCEHSAKMFVTVIKEAGKFVLSDSSACRTTRVVMDVQGIKQSNISEFNWYFNDFSGPGVITKNSPVAQTYRDAGIYPVGVIMKDIFGCKDTLKSILPVTIFGPKVNFASPFPGTCFASNVTFLDSSKSDGTNAIKKWTWDFGDGKKQDFANGPFSHQYDTAGVFDVTLRIIDAFGCRDSITKKAAITISKPLPRYTISDTVLCPGAPLVVTNTSTGLDVVYSWDFGDGYTTNEYSPTHSYSQEGIFKIMMRMVDKFGCKDSMSYNVSIFKAKSDYLMSDSFSSCPPLKVNFTNQSKNYTSFAWDFGDGGISHLMNPQHIYTYPGDYLVKLWVRNNGGCTDTLTKTVSIQGPSGVFDYVPKAVCNPADVSFTATTKNTVKYIWDFNDGSTIFSDQKTAQHTYTRPGLYIPKMILEDASGCRVPVVGLDTIKVNNIETKIFADNRMICDSGAVVFTDTTTTNDAIGTFLWNFGDGNTSTLRNPTHKYMDTGWHTVQLIATSAFGCKDTATIQNYIKVVHSPLIAITGDTSACVPSNLNFIGTLMRADTSTLKWNWAFGNGQTSTVQKPQTQRYDTVGSYPVTVQVTNADGCVTNVARTVNIRPNPVVDAGPDLIACRNTSVTLRPSGADSYVWNADPSLSCTNCETPAATPPNKMVYRVTGSTIYGCTATDSVTVNVQQPFTMNVGKGDSLCLGSSFKMSASGADRYQWTPAQFLDNSISATPVTKPDNTITYTVVGSDTNNCFTDTGRVTLFVRPIDVFIDGDTSACEPANLTFKGGVLHNDTSAISWNWVFGNGVISTQQNPSAQDFAKAGNYPVKLIVTTASGCSGSKETTAQINPIPNVQVPADTIICRFTPLNMVATGADTYRWKANPSLNCDTCAAVVATPAAKTIYEVTGTTIFGCVNSDTIVVNVTQPVVMDPGKGDTLCFGRSFQLIAKGADKYQWTPAIYLDNNNVANPLAKPDSTVTYQVIGRDSTNCFSDTGYVTLKVFPIEIAIEGALSACEPADLSFTGSILRNDSSAMSWSWDFGNGSKSSAQHPDMQNFKSAGNYPVTVSVVNANGCKGAAQVVAQINPIPKVDVGANAVICRDAPLTLAATGADSYTWDFTPTLNCLNCPSPVAKPDSTMMYAVTGRTVFGCVNRDSLLVTVNQPFVMTVGLGDTLCVGENTILVAQGAQKYEWTPSTGLENPLAGTTKANPANTITYQVIGKDSIGCFADTGRLTIQVYPRPQTDILAGADINLNIGSKVTLDTKNSQDVTKWVWTPTAGLSCATCPNPVATPKETTTYNVTVSNPAGCEVSDAVTVTVICNDVNIYIPNTFSPNEDGMNDYFFPRSSAGFTVKSFRVFNRWGQMVYQKNNFTSNNASDGWDGKMKGVKLTPDVYVYSFEIMCGNGSIIPVKGNVTLIR